MLKSQSAQSIILLMLCLGFLIGCNYFKPSFETAAALDQAGESSQALAAYQKYLKSYPSSPQASRIYYRIGQIYESQADYQNAVEWYEMILKDYPKTDEAMHALLDMADIYRDKIKDPAKAMQLDEQAFSRYMDNAQIRDSVQALIEDQVQKAQASFSQKDYKKVLDTTENIYQLYPAALIPPSAHAQLEQMRDRAHRAMNLTDASVDLITLKSEIPYSGSYESDFAPVNPEKKIMTSSNGKYLVTRQLGPDDRYYLYVATAPPKGAKPDFKRLSQTQGAEIPSWSPDGEELVYCRSVKNQQKMERINLKSMVRETLFTTKSKLLGNFPVYNPAGTKIAFVYAGRVGLIGIGQKTTYFYQGTSFSNNIGGTYFKQLLKSKLKLDYTAKLEWSKDGTMIRYRQWDKKGNGTDELLVLDVNPSNNP